MPLECCSLLGKLHKQRKFVAFFVYKIDEIPAIFSNLGDWRATKTRACFLRFSALKVRVDCLDMKNHVSLFPITNSAPSACLNSVASVPFLRMKASRFEMLNNHDLMHLLYGYNSTRVLIGC